MVLTNLIMLAGGYYLGVAREREKASRVVSRLVAFIELDVASKLFDSTWVKHEKKNKKEKK